MFNLIFREVAIMKVFYHFDLKIVYCYIFELCYLMIEFKNSLFKYNFIKNG